jgi:hypothetical protein
VLYLKGRIHARHIRQVTDTSTNGELSLTIDLKDEPLHSFTLFSPNGHRSRHGAGTCSALPHSSSARRPRRAWTSLHLNEFGVSARAMRMLSGATASAGETS